MHDVPCFSEEMSRKEHKNIMHTTNEDRVFVIVAPKPVQTPSMENVNKSADSEQSGPGKVSISQYC